MGKTMAAAHFQGFIRIVLGFSFPCVSSFPCVCSLIRANSLSRSTGLMPASDLENSSSHQFCKWRSFFIQSESFFISASVIFPSKYFSISSLYYILSIFFPAYLQVYIFILSTIQKRVLQLHFINKKGNQKRNYLIVMLHQLFTHKFPRQR